MLARSLSYALIATTFFLILLGGTVHTQGASLACPDWPLCYGLVFPPMVGDILLEHGHRLLASGVGLMTVLIAALTYRMGPPVRGWSLLGVGLVLFQGTLGGITVLLRLPPAVSIAHLGTSMLFFAWSVRMAWLLSPARLLPLGPAPALLAARPRLVLASGLLFAQLVMGAMVRHFHASLSCGTEALTCNGALLPSTAMQWLQTSHRLLALGVMAAIVVATVPVLKHARRVLDPGLRRLALAPHILVLLQILMGVLTIITGVHAHVVITHLALGALLWANMVLLVLRTSPVRRTEGDGAQPVPASFAFGQS